uniref:5-formyltetrahydrofolate cyclo-ligase n=1 Tax=Tanacetum cinerariifolium TaxID=118510 RepID=A0A699GEN9_TANCI|nr:hypothetical protein [Tanacetum cinerariifolium]
MTSDPRIPRSTSEATAPSAPGKADLRQQLLTARRAIDAATRAQWDGAIARQVVAWWQANRPATLGVYWPLQGEPDLSAAYAQLERLGARLLLPVVVARDAALEFSDWRVGEAMVKDAMGVAVPADLRLRAYPAALLVPCLGFNAGGYRLGYGGGFYDRTLARAPRPHTVGIAYARLQVAFAADLHDLRHHVQSERLDRCRVVAEAGQFQAHPAGDFRAAHVGKPHQLRVVQNRHDARHDRDVDAQLAGLFHELEIRVRIIKILGDRGVGAGLDLALERQQVVLRRTRLRVHLGVRRHFDMEPVARFLADELDQLAGVAELAGRAVTAGQVAAQRHDAADVVRLEFVQDGADRRAGAAHARQVRCGVLAGGQDFHHRVERAALGAAAGAEGHGKILGFQLGQPGARRQGPGNYAVQQCATDGGQEAVDAKAGHELRRQPERKAIDDEDKQAQRHDGHGQRQDHEHGADQRIDQGQYESGKEGGANACDIDGMHQHIHTDRIFAGVGVQLDLGDGLVRKRRAHHVRRVARAATEVHQAAFGQQDDALTRREDHVIDLRLDVFPSVFLERGNIDLVIEVADVADDGLVLHLEHVLFGQDVIVAGAGDENVAVFGSVIHGHHAVAFHRGLQRADRIDLGHPHLRRQRAHGLGRTLADVAVTGNHGHLAGDHDVGGALDTIDQRFAATVQVVEFRLGHGIVDVNGREGQLAVLVHLVQAVHAGGGFFGHAQDFRQAFRVPGRVDQQVLLDRVVQADFFFRGRVGQHRQIGFRAHAQVQQQRGVAAIVEDHVRVDSLAVDTRPFEDAVRVFPVVVQRLALDGKHRRARSSDGGGSMVLRGIDVARGPAHLRAQGFQGLDQHRGLDGHVDRPGNARAFQGLRCREFFADGHQARHFRFSDLDFFVAPCSQADIGDGVVVLRFEYGVHHALLSVRKK